MSKGYLICERGWILRWPLLLSSEVKSLYFFPVLARFLAWFFAWLHCSRISRLTEYGEVETLQLLT